LRSTIRATPPDSWRTGSIVDGADQLIATVKRESSGINIIFESSLPTLSAPALMKQIERAIIYLSD